MLSLNEGVRLLSFLSWIHRNSLTFNAHRENKKEIQHKKQKNKMKKSHV